MSWSQKTFTLPTRSRGSYLITDHVLQEVPEIRDYKVGMLNLFVQHTSCALSLNENWDDDVRADMSDALDRIAPMDKKGICIAILPRAPMICRLTSNLRSLALRSIFLSQTVAWQQEHGKAFGT